MPILPSLPSPPSGPPRRSGPPTEPVVVFASWLPPADLPVGPPLRQVALLIALSILLGLVGIFTVGHPGARLDRTAGGGAGDASSSGSAHLGRATAVASPGRAGAGGTTPAGRVGVAGGPAGRAGPAAKVTAPVQNQPVAATSATIPSQHTAAMWGPGYRLAAADGGVFAFGNARYLGSMGAKRLAAPVIGLAETPSGLGYWEVSSDGGVFAFGNARYLGGMAGHRLSRPVVGIAAAPDGLGYWLVSGDGGVFAFGSARYLGGAAGHRLSRPVVGMAATPDGGGYWLVSGDGGVFTFGDAAYYGGMGGHGIHARVVGMTAVPDGTGYWLVAADGGVFTYGTAHYYGGMGGRALTEPMVGISASPSGGGYWMVSADGGVFTYGDSGFWGAPGGFSLNQPVTAVASGIDPAFHAAEVEVAGRYGFDVSWPQCDDRGLPSGHAFSVVGATGGKAFTTNPCLAGQWAWATGASGAGGLYLNLNEPDPSGPRSERGPAGRCRHADPACLAYNYGGNAADAALSWARQSQAESPMWWLDVETENAWSSHLDVNALVIKGAIDQFHRRHHQVGVYSTSLQWGEITGGADFGVPVWVAGSPDLDSAPQYCARSFNGGPVWMVQTMLDYDVNFLCHQSVAAVAFGVHPLPSAPAFPLARLQSLLRQHALPRG